MDTTHTPFTIWQAHLAVQLGIGDEILRSIRKKMAEGVDWTRQGNRILFTEEAVQKIRAILVLPAQKNGPAGQPPINVLPSSGVPIALGPPPTPLQDRTELVVHRLVANRHIVEAHVPGVVVQGPGDVLRVRVRDSAHFIRGMVIGPVRFVQAPDLFEHVGRLPRFRGKY